jgi:hypothetical protein
MTEKETGVQTASIVSPEVALGGGGGWEEEEEEHLVMLIIIEIIGIEREGVGRRRLEVLEVLQALLLLHRAATMPPS